MKLSVLDTFILARGRFPTPLTRAEERIDLAVNIACENDEAHTASQKQWVIAQMLRVLLPEAEYAQLFGADWDEGTAPGE